jgi:hypothetical protein
MGSLVADTSILHIRDRPFHDTFAEKQLAKYGWEKGQSLGANGNGLTRAIEPKKRAEAVGIGADRGVLADWGGRWWEIACGKAMGRLGSGTNTPANGSESDSSEDEASKTAARAREAKKSLYLGSFVKAGTVIEQPKSDLVLEDGHAAAISYDTMFQACEGRTLSKARGLGQRGKLQRIKNLKDADAQLLEAARPEGWTNFWTGKADSKPTSPTEDGSAVGGEKSAVEESENVRAGDGEDVIETEASESERKRSRKARGTEVADEAEEQEDGERKRKKKKKSKSSKVEDEVADDGVTEASPRRKHSKSSSTKRGGAADAPEVVDSAVSSPRKKSKSKSKRPAVEDDVGAAADGATATTEPAEETPEERAERRRLKKERKRAREEEAGGEEPTSKRQKRNVEEGA